MNNFRSSKLHSLKSKLQRSALAALVVGAGTYGFAAPSTAHAQSIDCTTLPNPLYFTATTLLESLLKRVGPVLSRSDIGSTNQMSIVYFPASSCTAYDTFLNNRPLSGTAKYYKTDGTIGECTIPSNRQIRADLMAMDVGGATCLDAFPPSDLVEFPSHVETLGFIVPRTSSQTAITATEAFYIMKYAGRLGNGVSPWTDPTRVYVRNPGSSTQLTVGANIGVSGKLWNPALTGNRGSSNVRDAVIGRNATADAERTLGILNSSKWEANTDTIKLLAFEPFNGCLGAVFPDSTVNARDKQNVRDGHYPIWTNLRYVARRNTGGTLISPNSQGARVKRFIDLLTGVAAIPALPLTDFVVQTGNIPACAMHVKRDLDGGPMTPYDHPAPCDCSYVFRVTGSAPGCTSCTTSATCGGGVCRDGFCEPR